MISARFNRALAGPGGSTSPCVPGAYWSRWNVGSNPARATHQPQQRKDVTK
jgi:hypothetical protein